MRRLLSEDDFAFMENSPGVTTWSMYRMRANRRRVFRGYLTCLSEDFLSVLDQIRHLMVDSSESREDLAMALLRARAVFILAVFAVECRLLLHACGFSRMTISTVSLTDTLAQVQRSLAQLTPVTA